MDERSPRRPEPDVELRFNTRTGRQQATFNIDRCCAIAMDGRGGRFERVQRFVAELIRGKHGR